MERKKRDLKKLFETIEKRIERLPQSLKALDKLTGYIKGTEKPKRETLDKLSLLVGFQDWESFQKALHGEDDEEF